MKTPKCIVNNFQNKDMATDNQDRFKEEVSLAIYHLMQNSGLQYKELAQRLGCSKAYVSKILTGNHNFTIETIADIFMALGRAAHIHLDTNCEGATQATDAVLPPDKNTNTTIAFYNNDFNPTNIRKIVDSRKNFGNLSEDSEISTILYSTKPKGVA